MVYMVVEKHTPDLLYLKRSPGIRSWSLFVGMSVGWGMLTFVLFADKEQQTVFSSCDTCGFILISLSSDCLSWPSSSVLQFR